jgi:hypothetical protein
VVLNSQNDEIVTTVHKINYQVMSKGLSSLHSANHTKQVLQQLGFLGLPDCDQFNPKKKTAHIQLVGQILDAMLEQ